MLNKRGAVLQYLYTIFSVADKMPNVWFTVVEDGPSANISICTQVSQYQTFELVKKVLLHYGGLCNNRVTKRCHQATVSLSQVVKIVVLYTRTKFCEWLIHWLVQ